MKKIFLILSIFITLSAKASNDVDSVIVASKEGYTVTDSYIFSQSILLRKVNDEFTTFIVRITNTSTGYSKFYIYVNQIDIMDFPNGLYLLEIADDNKYLMSKKLVIQH